MAKEQKFSLLQWIAAPTLSSLGWWKVFVPMAGEMNFKILSTFKFPTHPVALWSN